jgi:hypothetical protein
MGELTADRTLLALEALRLSVGMRESGDTPDRIADRADVFLSFLLVAAGKPNANPFETQD